MSSLRERLRSARSSEDFAWACLLTNLIGVPGLGTILARDWMGLPQLALSIVGGVLLTWWIVAFVAAELRTMMLPPPGGPDLRLALWGLALFAVAWGWSLLSSVALLRAARARHPSAPPR